MKVKIGDQAPDFEVVTDEGTKIKLSDFRGKFVVLYFYPKDDTPGCRVEAMSFRDNFKDLEKLNAVVIGVSGDSVESHKKFKQKYSLPFILVSDEDGRIRELYGAKGLLVPPRVTFVIDKEGRIIHIYSSQLSPSSHVTEALKVIKGESEKTSN
ncbi:peroxiredoxin [Stygiolobus caldivivus]|uniref:thioredoxin-dependent peroxiredoxin n=1 Tax=Stygiolobus caldivivus TaxID=2824673 RepID=A0A8D5U5F4_9CREN|nr:peroxiredoxin [Stygiolobus caldivivus]BCU69648.1 peroxiredoxin [Stygiolobus caldivivus]